MAQNKKKRNKWLLPAAITSMLAVTVAIFAVKLSGNNAVDVNANNTADTAVTANADRPSDTDRQSGTDLVIPLNEISATAKFYPAEIDGTKLEVLAVKAPDGTVRTAFNTCQVCYDSGRGYYEQDGDVLVCQNCGNRFEMNQVEVVSGGCNPVPIFSENKTVSGDSITISANYLREAKAIFANWKSSY